MSTGPAIMLAVGLGVALVFGVWAISRAVKKRKDPGTTEDKKDDTQNPSA